MPLDVARSRFLTAEWLDLAMLSYQIDPAILAARVPAGCELDSFAGRMYVSVVGFRLLRTRVLGLPIPFHVNIAVANGKPALTRVSTQPSRSVVEVVSNPALDAPLVPALESLLDDVLVNEILVGYGSKVLGALPEFEIDLTALAPVGNTAVLKLEPLSPGPTPATLCSAATSGRRSVPQRLEN